MDKKTLESLIGSELVAQGFKKKASTWYRQTEEVLQVVNLQRSSFGLLFYLNLAWVPTGMSLAGSPTPMEQQWPKEYQCPIRIRVESAFPDQCKEFADALNLRGTSIPDAIREKRIARLMGESVLPFMNHMKTTAALREAIEQGVFKHGLHNLGAQRHLGIVLA